MKRQIIKIDEEKCNGCGLCIPNCPEGALQIIDGRARLISDLFCDGLGACIGNCPENAITTEEREAEPYDERRVMEENIIKAGSNTIKAHLKHLKDHGEDKLYDIAVQVLKEKNIDIPVIEETHSGCAGGECPGLAAQAIPHDNHPSTKPNPIELKSELRQWPVQLALINPYSTYFNNADLSISADCVPFAFANFHERFMKGKITITFCPKLDPTINQYIQKLSEIFKIHNIKSVTIVRMEVPCCGGMEAIIQRALDMAEKSKMVKVNIISIHGNIQ